MKTSLQSTHTRHFAVLAFLLLAAAFTLPRPHGCGSAGVTAAAQRGPARELAFTLLDGQPWRLSQERGQVVAVNFWATWCAPCRSETPALLRTVADLGPRGFEAIGISLDTAHDRSAQVAAFRATYGVNYPMAFPDPMSQIASGLDAIPTTLLIDRQGRTAKIYIGELDERAFRSDVNTLLAEASPSGRLASPGSIVRKEGNQKWKITSLAAVN